MSNEIEFPAKLRFLFEPHRYKVLWGGRAGIKSWSMATALVLIGAQRGIRWLCARELQKSLDESVHRLLELQIQRTGLSDLYRIEKARIYNALGTEFHFSGLRDAVNLKSYEDFDGVWVEEGANVSKRSWDILIPTIRKPNSEIWVSYNPELEKDETHQRFNIHPPPGAVVVKTSYRDNRWLSSEMQTEIEALRESRPDDFEWIYEGVPRVFLDGAIYADELRALARDGRIANVPYTPGVPVNVFCDLGIADFFAMWFEQSIAFEWRFIDFYQNRNKAIGHYIAEMQKRGYVIGTVFLPHDGKRRDLGTGKSIEHHLLEAGYRVKIVPQIGLKNGMDAARNLFARSWFDSDKCTDGLNCLRRYTWKLNEQNGIVSREPLHDDNSNGADAYRYAAVGLTEPERKTEERRRKLVTLVSPWS